MTRIVSPLLMSVLVLLLPRLGLTLDPPHDSTNTIDCSACHTAHKAVGGTITKAVGNANLCQSCHMVGGLATSFPMDEGDQALPGLGLPSGVSPTGFSHRWDSGASGHVEAVGTPVSTGTVQSSGAFTGRYSKTYTITVAAGGDVGVATFNWTAVRWPGDTGGGSGNNVATAASVLLDEGISAIFTDGTTPSFIAGDQWRIYVRTDVNQPTITALAARISDGKIMCSTCHNQHSQAALPFDPSAPAYGGSGTGAGRHFQRIDNGANEMCLDCHSARNKGSLSGQTGNLSHPIGLARSIWNGLFKARASITLPLDKGVDGLAGNTDDRIQCLSCHQPHYAPSSDGSLTRMTNITSLCTDCHTLANPGTASHLNTTTGVLWPGPAGGQYSSTSTFPEITDTSKRGACINCHQPHGWPDSATPSQDYAKLLVDKQENLCYTCHDGTVTTTANVYAQFNGATNFQAGIFNQRHDVSDADQTNSQGVVECVNCHNPHLATGTNKLINPDEWSDGTTTFVAGQAFTKTYSPTNQYGGACYDDTADPASGCATTNLDPVNPEGLPAGPSIGPAVEGVHNGDDLGTSNQGTGTYTGTEDLTYLVTISPGGTPGAGAGISVTTGSSTECPVGSPCTAPVTAFNTFVNVGNFGVQIKFADGGSGGTPSTIGTPVCTNGGGGTCSGNVSSDDTATSSGTYTGPSNGTYTLTVTTAGCVSGSTRCPAAIPAVISCTSNISGDACNPSATYSWPQATPFAIGSYGVQVTITDSGTRERDWELLLNQQWTIAVTAASGDGLLQSGDTWTIVASAGGPTFSEPDYIAFCLTCHDGSPPPGVTMPGGVDNLAARWLTNNRMGAAAGGTGTSIGNGYLKEPWTDQTARPGQDPTHPYAALNCTVCHDGHGSDSLFHLRTSITVGGVALQVGGQSGSQFGVGSADPVTGTTYSLPLIGGVQQAQYWGAWCTFCHEMSSHPAKIQTDSCPTAHSHSGTNF